MYCDDPDCGHHVHGHRHDHSQVFRTWSYETEEPLSLEALRETARKLPGQHLPMQRRGSYRRRTGPRVILQVVGKRVDIAVGDEWNGREPRTRIIAIGAHDGVDGAALREAFDRCRCYGARDWWRCSSLRERVTRDRDVSTDITKREQMNARTLLVAVLAELALLAPLGAAAQPDAPAVGVAAVPYLWLPGVDREARFPAPASQVRARMWRRRRGDCCSTTSTSRS